MLKFPCHSCGHPFEMPDDTSGEDTQCPQCGVLVSVPYASDLSGLNPDGTIRAAPIEIDPTSPAERAARLQQAFRNPLVISSDPDSADQIDNRTLPEYIDLAPLPPPPPPKPRYDPETGELIRPINVSPPTAPSVVPALPAAQTRQVALGYAAGGAEHVLPSRTIWLSLVAEPANLVVMSVIIGAHIGGAFLHFFISYIVSVWVMVGGFYIAPWLFNLAFFLVLAHYGNVIEEVTQFGRHELPRPLREMSPVEDILRPMVRVLLAFGLCYLPAVVVFNLPISPVTVVLLLATLVAGGLLFPAVLLACCGGDTLANLRPDRVLAVVRHGGMAYRYLAVGAVVLVPLYLHVIPGIDLIGPLHDHLTPYVPNAPILWRLPLVATILSLVLVYAMHGFCWELGLLYRKHRQSLGWVWDQIDQEREAARIRRFEATRQAALQRRQQPPGTL